MAKNDTAWIILGVVAVGGLVFFLSRRPVAPVAVPVYDGLPPVMPPTPMVSPVMPPMYRHHPVRIPEVSPPLPPLEDRPQRLVGPLPPLPFVRTPYPGEFGRRLAIERGYKPFLVGGQRAYLPPDIYRTGWYPFPPNSPRNSPPYGRRRWTGIRENLPPGWRDLGRYQPGDFERGIARPPAIISPYYIRA